MPAGNDSLHPFLRAERSSSKRVPAAPAVGRDQKDAGKLSILEKMKLKRQRALDSTRMLKAGVPDWVL